jgi:hypothetical protein
MRECNNVSSCHKIKIIDDGDTVMRVICQECHHQYFIRKDPYKQTPEIRQYAEICKRDILQGNDPLFYKYYPWYLNY